MGLPPLRFVPHHRLDGVPNVVVDGSPVPGTVLTVTHWPGYPPPPGIEDDLSAQMAFRLLERPDLVPPGVEVVTNNHYDQDGLVSVFALVDPDEAVPRRRFLEEVASAGDFAVCHDRDAARVSAVVAAWARADGLPADADEARAVLYEDALGRLPDLCDHVDRYRELWAEEDAALDAAEAAFAAGRATIEERPEVDLAVVTVVDDAGRRPGGSGAGTGGGHRFAHEWAPGLHPMAVHNRTERATVARIQGRRYDVELRYEGWVQLRSRKVRPRRDLVPLAERLQAEETGDAVWTATPVGRLLPRLRLGEGQESSLPPERFLELLVGHLRTAPPAWDPYRPV
ncbi:MAG TPA: DUF6687 family protein [Acidimicrobiales bacterium]